MDYKKLKGAIRGKYGTQAVFAKEMDLSVCSLNKKLNGRTEWTAADMRKAMELLDIPAHESPAYFFCPEC